MDNEVYVLTIHDEDTFQILGIYSDYLKADEDRRGYIKYNSSFYFRADLRITLMKLNELYSFEKFQDSDIILIKSPLKLDNYNQITFSNATAQYNGDDGYGNGYYGGGFYITIRNVESIGDGDYPKEE